MKRAFRFLALALFPLPFTADVADAQSAPRAAALPVQAVMSPAPAALKFRSTFEAPIAQPTHITLPTVGRLEFTALPTWPNQESHDGNYARRGAIIGAVTTGAVTAFLMGHYAKRNCQPGFCGSDFGRGALVGGSVGLAGGGVLGWIIGSSIARR